MAKTNYTVTIKHEFVQSKSYKYNSNKRFKIGDEVVLRQSNGSKALGVVLNCTEGSGKWNGQVLHRVNRNKRKLHNVIADLILKDKIQIKQEVYETYKFITLANENTTYEQFKRKLARNIILSDGAKMSEFPNTIQFQYGSCKYFVNLKTMTVTYMNNGYKVPKNWVKNKPYYYRLNMMLGIDNDKVSNKSN